MAVVRFIVVVALAVGAGYFLTVWLFRRLNPADRALRRAGAGQLQQALDDIKTRVERKPSSAALRGALGRLYLLNKRPEAAEAEFRQALELGSRDPLNRAGLGWALVRQGQYDEALALAEEAQRKAPEDFGLHCLYCGLLARHGRAREAVELFDFLKRRSVQIQMKNPREYDQTAREQFEFSQSEMRRAGLG